MWAVIVPGPYPRPSPCAPAGLRICGAAVPFPAIPCGGRGLRSHPERCPELLHSDPCGCVESNLERALEAQQARLSGRTQ